MNRSKEYPGFWHAVLLCVTFVPLQMVFIIPFAILDAVFKLRLIWHPAVLGIVNLSACALVVTMGWLIGRPAMSEVCALRRVSRLAWWYARTQSLVPSLIGHALANAMVVGHAWLPFEVRGFNASDPVAGSELQPAWFDALGVLLLAAGLWLFQRATPAMLAPVESPAESQPPPLPSGPDFPST